MYEVLLNHVLKDHDSESFKCSVIVADLERALALASLLQKISTPEVMFGDIVVQPAKFI